MTGQAPNRVNSRRNSRPRHWRDWLDRCPKPGRATTVSGDPTRRDLQVPHATLECNFWNPPLSSPPTRGTWISPRTGSHPRDHSAHRGAAGQIHGTLYWRGPPSGINRLAGLGRPQPTALGSGAGPSPLAIRQERPGSPAFLPWPLITAAGSVLRGRSTRGAVARLGDPSARTVSPWPQSTRAAPKPGRSRAAASQRRMLRSPATSSAPDHRRA